VSGSIIGFESGVVLMDTQKTKMVNGYKSRLVIFYLIALVVSNLFRFKLITISPLLLSVENTNILWVILEGSGIAIAAYTALHLLKQRKKLTYSLFGTSKFFSVLCFILPVMIVVLVPTIAGVPTKSIGYLFTLSSVSLIYCLMEEAGWRYYLQEELMNLPKNLQYLIIGSLWYFWHLSFIQNHSIINNITFWLSMVIASWGLGQVLESTRSILASASAHLMVGMMITNQLMMNTDYGIPTWMMVVIMIISYVALVKYWEKRYVIASKN
jgi:hypothetical protein